MEGWHTTATTKRQRTLALPPLPPSSNAPGQQPHSTWPQHQPLHTTQQPADDPPHHHQQHQQEEQQQWPGAGAAAAAAAAAAGGWHQRHRPTQQQQFSVAPAAPAPALLAVPGPLSNGLLMPAPPNQAHYNHNYSSTEHHSKAAVDTSWEDLWGEGEGEGERQGQPQSNSNSKHSRLYNHHHQQQQQGMWHGGGGGGGNSDGLWGGGSWGTTTDAGGHQQQPQQQGFWHTRADRTQNNRMMTTNSQQHHYQQHLQQQHAGAGYDGAEGGGGGGGGGDEDGSEEGGAFAAAGDATTDDDGEDAAGDEQQQEQEVEEVEEEEVQLEFADFDLSREEVIARIEQLAFDVIASTVQQQQLPTLSCISTARSNVHMAPRHSSTTAAGGMMTKGAYGGFSTQQQTQQMQQTQQTQQLQGSIGYTSNNADNEEGWEQGTQPSAAGGGGGGGVGGSSSTQQQQQQQQHVLRLGSRVTTKSLVAGNGTQANSVVRALQLLDSVHALLRAGRSSTQRDVYYSLVGRPGFERPRDVTSAIQSVLGMLRLPRAALGISAASKGAVAGCLLLRPGPGEAWVDCRSVGSSGRPIPGEVGAVDATAFRPAGARCILVVEKDAVFQSLVDSRLHEQLPCIIITGRGMPDVASRAFLAAVVEASRTWGGQGGAGGSMSGSLASQQIGWRQQQQQQAAAALPVLGLVDWNPGGVGILLAYKYGCAGLGLESARYAVPLLAWLGVTADMLQEGRVPQSRCHELTARDKALMPGLKARLEAQQNPEWVAELAEMEGSGLKAGIEALQHEELMRQLQRRVLQGYYLR